MSLLTVNDFQMAYSDNGEGKPVVLIHGYPLNRKMWDPQVRELSDSMRLIAPDLRGHGDSQPAPGPYSMELFADDLAILLDQLHIQQKVVICGLSMGGYAAFAFYRKFRERVRALILTATRAADDSAQAKAARDQAAETAKTNGIEPVVDSLLPKLLAPGTFENNPVLVGQVKSIMLATSLPGMLGDLEGMKNRPDSRPYLDQVNVPTLILHGAEDQLIPAQEAKEMHSAIPNARLQFIPRAGHLLNLEQPALFNAAVRSFCAGLTIEEEA